MANGIKKKANVSLLIASILCVFVITPPTIAGHVPSTMAVQSASAAALASTASVDQPSDPATADEGVPPPMLLMGALMVLFVIAAFLLLLILMGAAGTIVLIVASSAVVGVVTRKPSTAMRALFLQLGAAGGAACCIVAIWLGSTILGLHLRLLTCAIVGGIVGAAGGLAVAMLFNFIWTAILRRLRPQASSKSSN